MSEEANEAIDLLKFYEGFFKNIGHEEEVKSIESVINCIEKLKKENEELRQNYDIATTKIEELRKKLSLKCFDVNVVYNDYLEKLREFKSNSIPKDKIIKLEDMWNDNIWNATDEASKEKAEMIRDVYRGLLDE